MTTPDRQNRRWPARAGRSAAVGVVILAVCAQIAAIALGAGGTYWPFLRYPMYSVEGRDGFSHRELCVRVGDDARSLNSLDLGLTRFRFFGILGAAGDDTPAGQRTRDRLSALVARYIGAGARIELWQADYRLGPDGLEDPRPRWYEVRAWDGASVGDPGSVSRLPRVRQYRLSVRSGQCGLEGP